MKTKLKYLDNDNIFQEKARLIKIDKDEKGTYLVFDSTIFYPQGGGQESDKGYIILDNKDKIDINYVQDFNGVVHHYINCENFNIKQEYLEMVIDKERRIINSKSHTAGHLIACLVEKYFNFKAIKAYHFLNGPYVEFETETKLDIKEDINFKLEEEIKKNSSIFIKYLRREELEKNSIYVPSFLGDNIRVMEIEGHKPIPCGGTHLKFLSELKNVKITKTKYKKNRLKVSYTFS